MILVFGGTTEGKRVAQLFDTIQQSYFYSTRTDAHREIKGKRIFGAMDQKEIMTFCVDNDIRLIVNAAHPFAIQLHKNIYQAAKEGGIKTIRYERIFPSPEPSCLIRYFSTYEEMVAALLASRYQNILALTGVQTIPTFKLLSRKRNCYFRILDTLLSRQKAQETGIPMTQVIPMTPDADVTELIKLARLTKAEILLSKESGESGFFETKVQASHELNIPLWVVQRPSLPFDQIVDDPKDFLQLFYQIKKTVLKQEGHLRSGFTTGTCVTAAAKACFLALVGGIFPDEVEVELLAGVKAGFTVFPQFIKEDSASCIVIKDAGDDPDVTHGKEIGCELTILKESIIRFEQGEGVGVVTLPGFQLAIGEPAINPVPREMITLMLNHMSNEYDVAWGFAIKPFVPEGKELAKQTFNPRIGVEGGISILGTSGKVMPFSNDAFLASIKQQIKVAKGNGCAELVLTSGKRSENRVKSHFTHLPAVAFIHFGNLVGDTLKLAVAEGFKILNLAIMFGKGVKLAEGHMDTHSKNVTFNPEFLALLAKKSACSASQVEQIKRLKLANAITDIIPFSEEEGFYPLVARTCQQQCLSSVQNSCHLKLFLQVGETAEIVV